MKLDNQLFDNILRQAMESPRKRMHFDLRTQAEMPGQAGHDGDADWRDMSQRMLNVLMPETVIPIHRHNETSETVIVCRGAVREEFYDEKGRKIAEFVLEAGGDCPGVQVPRGMYHTCVCLVPGSVIFEAKDRPYDPELTEEFLKSE
ncbi:MAG: WbuC family cupin fold metalloprotein [Bacteroidales bacterium]|nr:WbuC family cupin fold metalloprotein [Bacteroidales bacterium]